MADMVEYYQQISEIRRAIRERELHRLELEKEALTKAHKREKRHEELRGKLKDLHQELVREEAEAAQRTQCLLSQVESVRKEHQQLAIQTEKVREKKRQYEMKFVTASSDHNFSSHQSLFGNIHNTDMGASKVMTPAPFSTSAPPRPHTTLYTSMSPLMSSLPTTSNVWPSQQPDRRLQAVEQMWMQQDKSLPPQVPFSEVYSQPPVQQESEHIISTLKPSSSIESSHAGITFQQNLFPSEQDFHSSRYPYDAPVVTMASRESGTIQPSEMSTSSLEKKDNIANKVSFKQEEPVVSLASKTVGQDSLVRNENIARSNLPQLYYDTGISEAKSAIKYDNNIEPHLENSSSDKEHAQENTLAVDNMVSHPLQYKGTIPEMESEKEMYLVKRLDELNNQRITTSTSEEETIRPSSQVEDIHSKNTPLTADRELTVGTTGAHVFADQDAPPVLGHNSSILSRKNSGDESEILTYNMKTKPVISSSTETIRETDAVNSYSFGTDNEEEKCTDGQDERTMTSEGRCAETPVHPSKEIKSEATEVARPQKPHSPPEQDDSDFFDRTSPVTASAAYQRLARGRGGGDVGTESESEGVEGNLALPHTKTPHRSSFKTFASSIPSLRPGPSGTDTDSVDSVEAAIQAAMRTKKKNEPATSSAPNAEEEGDGTTPVQVAKTIEAAGDGVGKVGECKKYRPAAALRLTLESDEESCGVSAGAEASDEDDFDFYDKF